jgi:hypothetical protein
MTMRMTISKDFKFLATSCNIISTINIFDANELISIYKDGHINMTLPLSVPSDQSPSTPRYFIYILFLIPSSSNYLYNFN